MCTFTHSYQCQNKSLEDALKRSERDLEKQTEVKEKEKEAQIQEIRQLTHQNRGINSALVAELRSLSLFV